MKLIIKNSWIKNKNNLKTASLIFLLSTIFVTLYAKSTWFVFNIVSPDIESACIFDCRWYSTILENGYHREPPAEGNGNAANWAFFPIYPIIAKALSLLTGFSAFKSLVLTSVICYFFSIFFFIKLVEEKYGSERVKMAGLILAFNPYVIYAYVGYTETLYFLITTIAFINLNRNRWIWAGIAGCILSSVRFVGIVFVFSYIVVVLQKSPSIFLKDKAILLGLLMCPLGLALYMYFLYFYMGDPFAFKNVQIAWDRQIGNPLSVIVNGLRYGGWQAYFAIVSIFSLFIVGLLVRKGLFIYAFFLFMSTIIPLSTGLDSMPRYVFWQMPFILGLVELFSKSKFLICVYMAFSSSLGALMTISWFLQKPFVI